MGADDRLKNEFESIVKEISEEKGVSDDQVKNLLKDAYDNIDVYDNKELTKIAAELGESDIYAAFRRILWRMYLKTEKVLIQVTITFGCKEDLNVLRRYIAGITNRINNYKEIDSVTVKYLVLEEQKSRFDNELDSVLKKYGNRDSMKNLRIKCEHIASDSHLK